MPGVRTGRWAVVTAALASVAVPVCTSGQPIARHPGHPTRYAVGHPARDGGQASFAVLTSHRGRGTAEPGHARLTALEAPTAGLLSNTTAAEGVPPALAADARYVRGSHVLRLASGRWMYLPDARTAAAVVAPGHPPAQRQIEASRAWLASGRVPGATPARREAAERALLAMRALIRPNGAVAAGWSHGWKYSWPRDSSFASAAFAHTGHDAEAYRILRYSAATQRADGGWEARTKLDGSGPPDARARQLDANGWVPWATWQWYRTAPVATRGARLAALYPMIRKAADHAAGSLRADGLPPASPDYWELTTATANIGTAAPLLAGLNASADLAREANRPEDAARWARAARRLSAGISARFLPLGYQRTVDGRHGHDSAVAFMAPPFNEAPAALAGALATTYRELLLPNGGLTPGNDPGARWGAYAWTPSTAFFALAWAGTGRPEEAGRVLDWVLSKRNALGELPEKVDGKGRPCSVAPLAWTGSIAVLALVALEGPGLPTPPRA
ncbi:hypothetical protein [Streptomyces sp. NBC_01264]|uniref:hypothetical protein n=1 Tax=Streptomyces sp. NBC_01264 TaxID=2903804 RepID=UPI002250D678|nr:hypothetical protein [Streptomyces sp. NBC_01264]MCX4775680.1 hypothetical protein [Streptomyces sp. NBC_01264]